MGEAVPRDRASWLARLRAHLAQDRRLLQVMSSLAGTQVVTALLGFCYWTLAARLYPVAAVGRASAAVGAMTLLATVAMLGFGTLLIAELQGSARSRGRELVAAALVTSGIVGLVLGALGALALAPLSAPLAFLGEGPGQVMLFAAAVGLAAVGLVCDEAVLAAGSGLVQLVRNTIASLVKLAALGALALLVVRTATAVFASWQVGTLLSLLSVLALWPVSRGRVALGPGLVRLRGLARDAVGHHTLNLSLQAPTMLLPVVVALVLSTEENAYFTTIRLVCASIFILPFALTVALFVQSAGDAADLLGRVRRTVPLGLGVSAAANVALLVAGQPLLHAFGEAYAAAGGLSLHLLALGGLPLVVKDHYVALRRVQGRTLDAAKASVAGAVLEVAGAALGGTMGGIEGVCVGWVLALVVEAVFCGVVVGSAVRAGAKS